MAQAVIGLLTAGGSAFSIFKGAKAAGEKPEPFPAADDPRVKAAKDRQRRALAARKGRRSTILGAASGERDEAVTPTRLLGG